MTWSYSFQHALAVLPGIWYRGDSVVKGVSYGGQERIKDQNRKTRKERKKHKLEEHGLNIHDLKRVTEFVSRMGDVGNQGATKVRQNRGEGNIIILVIRLGGHNTREPGMNILSGEGLQILVHFSTLTKVLW